MDTTPSTRSSAGLARWAPLGGILYVVLFVIGVIVMVGDEPNSSGSPAKIIAYYSKSSHRDRISEAIRLSSRPLTTINSPTRPASRPGRGSTRSAASWSAPAGCDGDPVLTGRS